MSSRAVAKKVTVPPPCVQAAPPVQNLKDDFAKSSLRVLKMIEGETGEISQGPDGSTRVPRSTSQALDDLDVDAQSKDDQAVVSVLKDFFLARVTDNMYIEILSTMAHTTLLVAGLPRGPLQTADLVSKSPTVVKIGSIESACSLGLEAALRSRNYQNVPACTQAALNVDMPKEFDVAIQPTPANP